MQPIRRLLVPGTVAFALAAALVTVPTGAEAQTAAPDSTVGALIIAHGAGPEWNAQVEAVAREVKLAGPVGVSYLMGPGAKTHRFQDVVAALADSGATEIVVVPVLVSSHSGHYDQIRYLTGELDSLSHTMRHHLHMAGIERPTAPVSLRLAPAMDDSPEVAAVLVERARALAEDPSEQALFLIGHGPNSAEDYAAWMDNLRRIADTVKARTGFKSVLVDLVRDDAPDLVRAEAVRRIRELIALQHELTGRDVAVVPVLVSTGRMTRETFPRDLAGLPIVYSGEALLPHPGLARWVEARVRQEMREETAGR